MVQPQLMQQSRMEVVNIHLVFHGGEAEIVGRSVDMAAFEAPARNQIGESVVVVVAAVLRLHQAADLDRGRPPEFAADDDDGFLQQSARLEVVDQCRNRAIGLMSS
jgi:hypothetical protein